MSFAEYYLCGSLRIQTMRYLSNKRGTKTNECLNAPAFSKRVLPQLQHRLNVDSEPVRA
jgi:hypothetical protein